MAILQDMGGAGDRKGRKGGMKGMSNCFKLVKMTIERNMQPLIVFSFSRRDCEAYALEVSKMDFSTG